MALEHAGNISPRIRAVCRETLFFLGIASLFVAFLSEKNLIWKIGQCSKYAQWSAPYVNVTYKTYT